MSDSIPSLLIRRTDVPAVYGLDARLVRRLCEDHRLSRVYLGGPTGSVYLVRAELDALIAEATIPPGKPAGR